MGKSHPRARTESSQPRIHCRVYGLAPETGLQGVKHRDNSEVAKGVVQKSRLVESRKRH